MPDWLDVSDTTPRIAYTASPGQTVFTVPFAFLDETHLQVYVDDVLQALSTDYVTSGEEDPGGGDVTFNVALAGGESVVIQRTVDVELTTHIPITGPLDVPAINLQFSLFVMMLQQAIADWPRSIRQPASDETDFDELPVAAPRASKYLGFDANGQVAVFASVDSAVAASAFMLTLLDDTDAATARATLGITSTDTLQAIFNWQNFH